MHLFINHGSVNYTQDSKICKKEEFRKRLSKVQLDHSFKERLAVHSLENNEKVWCDSGKYRNADIYNNVGETMWYRAVGDERISI